MFLENILALILAENTKTGEKRGKIFTRWFQLNIPARMRVHTYTKILPSPSATNMGEGRKKKVRKL